MKKTISIILFVCMLLSYSASFSEDMQTPLAPPSEWAADAVQKGIELNITSNKKSYNYRAAINREDFCELTYNFIVNVIKAPIPKAQNNFTDTNSINVNVLCDMGIIKGKADGIFAPNHFLTREEAATIIVRTVNLLMPVAAREMYYVYNDEADISPWAANSIQLASNMGIMKGTGNNNFSPKGIYTTEEAIVVLIRLSEIYKSNYSQDSCFADKLISQMPQDKNYMLSPISIKMALSIAANGAGGETRGEILKLLGISDLNSFNVLSKDLINRYSQTENLRLSIANSIWINSDKTPQKFSSAYESKMKEFYSADVLTVNNSNAVGKINSWVNEKTNGKISTITDNADFWASLINAIYFKAAWQKEFSKSATKRDEFTSQNGTKTQIDFMNKREWLSAFVSKNVTAVELPYKNRFEKISSDGSYLGSDVFSNLDVSMFLLMGDGLKNPEEKLNSLISSKSLSSTYTKLSVPKFKIEFSTSLNQILQNLGINSAFNSQKADFKNMFESGNMFITDTIHKTYISVDEEGTEAAAVTAISMAGSALLPEPIEIKFNKPFYFLVRDNTSGELLFVGSYAYAN